ncbi:prolyl aminopeptidase [Paremcibacter congregatus]|uniref:Proline iminopeptidase n=1 Tax=Paremcibacter congregatus TaxID=2043170 RepID=A0A2G4YVU3_9PROT|nr:prolyl aminopeptidase [Paremcibacter congregatus]PHZ86360.1 prolyl aminopeptidase [Paremcibacter congregatus]QDE27994.1 prolyl aminopeptidase [Paremcibacter congregatus]
MNSLFPPITPYNQFELPVTTPHVIHVEECGNPGGLPVIFIHGGPGGGYSSEDRQFFDPTKYRIILFDQRGCGRSRPLGCIENNETKDLIEDIEIIRKKLHIEKWAIFGGSWGSTLSLLYAEKYPSRTLALILRGIFLATKAETAHLCQEGMSLVFPEEFENYKNLIPLDKQDDLLGSYYNIIKGDNKELAHQAALAFVSWESNGFFLEPMDSGPDVNEEKDIANGIVECHYLTNGCFITEDQILDNIDKINRIPMFIVHGRFDSITTPSNAWRLFKSHLKATLQITENAAHASREKTTASVLIGYTNEIADQFSEY